MADSQNSLTPPHNLEAEEAVVGSVLIDPESFFDVAQFLKAEDFYLVKHRWVWEVFVSLHDARSPVDLLTVQDELDKRGQLAEVGEFGRRTTALVRGSPRRIPSKCRARSGTGPLSVR